MLKNCIWESWHEWAPLSSSENRMNWGAAFVLQSTKEIYPGGLLVNELIVKKSSTKSEMNLDSHSSSGKKARLPRTITLRTVTPEKSPLDFGNGQGTQVWQQTHTGIMEL